MNCSEIVAKGEYAACATRAGRLYIKQPCKPIVGGRDEHRERMVKDRIGLALQLQHYTQLSSREQQCFLPM